MKKSIGVLILSLYSLLCFSIFASAQSQSLGAVEGIVATPEGEALPGAEVKISSPSLIGGAQSMVTNAKGRYRFPALPPGVYIVEAKLEGFIPQSRKDLRISVGTTLRVDFTLQVAALNVGMSVIAQAPMVDIKGSQTGITEMTNTYLEKLPSARSMRDQLKFAPGVTSESTFGSSQSLGNNFLIDGVKINSPEAGEAEVAFDYDSIQEMQVAGIGAPAEYDGYSGAIINTVSKSGGNTLSGLLTFYLQSPSWHSQNSTNPDLIYKNSYEDYDVHFNLGGPIIKDRLWFFVAGKYEYKKQQIEDYTGPTMYREQYRGMGKLDWQLGPNNRLNFLIEWNSRPTYNADAGPLMAPEALTVEDRYQTLFNLNYLHIFSNTTFLEAKLGGYDQKDHIHLQSDNPPHVDLVTGYLSGNYYIYLYAPRQRIQINTVVTHHAEDFLKGSHDFKFGIEGERSGLTNSMGFPGGKYYLDNGTTPYLLQTYDGYSATPTTWSAAGFAEDSWTIGRLTINPGIRLNYWRGTLPGLGAVFTPKMGFSPRLGFSFDLLKDHSTVLKAHYGKYYHSLIGMMYLHFQPQGTFSEYSWNGESWDLNYQSFWENKYTVDPNLKMPYMNQFVVSIEREIAQDFSASVLYIDRSNHDLIDRVNITGQWDPVQWTGPNGQTYTVYERLNPGDDRFLVTNPKAGVDYGAAFPGIVSFTPTRKYRGFELSFTKRYSRGWQLAVSYDYGRATGSDDNTWGEYGERRTSSLGAGTLFSNPNYQINAVGLLGIDPTHMLKVSGSYEIPKIKATLGFFYSFISGNTYNMNLALPDTIDPDPVSTSGPPYVYVLANRLGSYRYPSQHNLDVRLEKYFQIKGTKVGFMVDVFNVFNAGTVTDVQTDVNPLTSYPFGYVWGIVLPRTFRAGFRFTF